MTKKKAEVAKKEETAVSTDVQEFDMSHEVAIDPSDIIVPKVLLMQPTSTFVSEEKAKLGELRGSLEGELLAGKDESMELIIFHSTKTWTVFDCSTNNPKFKEIFPFTPKNSDLPQEEVVDGVAIRRDRTLNYYALRPEDIKEGMYFPYLLSCRRTSYTAGRKIESVRGKFQAFKKPLYIKTMKISANFTENDKGKFYVLDAVVGRDTTEEERKAVQKWLDVVRSTDLKVDNSDLETPDDSTVDASASGDTTTQPPKGGDF